MANKFVPQEIEAVNQMTLENLLMEKFRVLQLAREEGNDGLFDTISQSIEILLKANPYAHKDLMEIKDEMTEDLEKEYQEILNDANKAQDEIYRQHILDSRVGEADWIFRITYEETLIEIFQKHRIIGFMSTETPTLIEEETEPEPEPEPEEEQEELDIKDPNDEKTSFKRKIRVGKPKLSIKRT